MLVTLSDGSGLVSRSLVRLIEHRGSVDVSNSSEWVSGGPVDADGSGSSEWVVRGPVDVSAVRQL